MYIELPTNYSNFSSNGRCDLSLLGDLFFTAIVGPNAVRDRSSSSAQQSDDVAGLSAIAPGAKTRAHFACERRNPARDAQTLAARVRICLYATECGVGLRDWNRTALLGQRIAPLRSGAA